MLKKVIYEYQLKNGSWEMYVWEVYDCGNGVMILLYNKVK